MLSYVMPELPEVQTVVSELSTVLISKTVLDYKIYRQELRRDIPVIPLENLKGQTIIDCKRRAKWPALVFPDGCLWMHLGMTGQILIVHDVNALNHQHTHLHLKLDDGTFLVYQDARRFGIIDWTIGPESDPPSDSLGPEPLDPNFDQASWKKRLKKSKKPIKPWLMDGKNIAGVGNIYASEALFKSKIHPDAPANLLTEKQATQLYESIVSILQQAVDQGGSTLRDYRRPDGSQGAAQHSHAVYARAFEPCYVCGSKIKTRMHSNRATFWCSTCQPWSANYVQPT